MRLAIILGLFVLVAAVVRADTVFLTNGKVLHGSVTEEDGKVVVQLPSGSITLAKEQIARIEPGPTVMDVFDQRFAGIDAKAPGAAEQLVELAHWCEARRMHARARQCYEKAIVADPENAAARAALGFVRYAGTWMTSDERNRDEGLVLFRKAWVKPEERDRMLRAEEELQVEKARADAERLAAGQTQSGALRPNPRAYARGVIRYFPVTGRDRPSYYHRIYRPNYYAVGGGPYPYPQIPTSPLTGPWYESWPGGGPP
jgi:hypothetical protein